MSWQLRKKPQSSLPKPLKLAKLPTVQPPFKPIKPIEPIRPVKPIAPFGYEYFWKRD